MGNPEETPSNRQRIQANGWCQGATLPLADVQSHIKTHVDLKQIADAQLLVISQSCDVLCDDLKAEPYVECLLLRPLKKLSESCCNGRNPRKLHINIFDRNFEIYAKDVCFLDKLFLIGNPCPHSLCSPDNANSPEWLAILRTMRKFRANRYTRTGLPEAFAILTRTIFDRNEPLTKGLEQFDPCIERIYIRLNPFSEEAPNGYQVGIIALVKNDTGSDISYQIEQMLDEHLLMPLSETEGITLENFGDGFEQQNLTSIMSKREFTLDLLDSFLPYYYDPISMKLGSE